MGVITALHSALRIPHSAFRTRSSVLLGALVLEVALLALWPGLYLAGPTSGPTTFGQMVLRFFPAGGAILWTVKGAVDFLFPGALWTGEAVVTFFFHAVLLAFVGYALAVWRMAGQPLPLRWVLVRDPAGHCPPIALCCTDPTVDAEQVIGWFVPRWSIEVTFAEARVHLGFETQRQWSTPAIGRTTPCLLGLFSLVVLMAKALHPEQVPIRQTAWYANEEATFADALAAVRTHLRVTWNWPGSVPDDDPVVIPRRLWLAWTDGLADAA